MCGRYFTDATILSGLNPFVQIPKKTEQSMMYPSDIVPSSLSWILTAGAGKKMHLVQMRWGYPIPGKKGVIFNARTESVEEKKIFRNGFYYHRAVVPAVCFYEWNSLKEKFTFCRKDGDILYMAAVSDLFENELRYTILTTKANESVKRIHDRMPLILEKTQIERWISDEKAARQMLFQIPVQLKVSAEYEQQTLF